MANYGGKDMEYVMAYADWVLATFPTTFFMPVMAVTINSPVLILMVAVKIWDHYGNA